MKRLKVIINHTLVKHNQNITIILINTQTLQHIYLVQLIIDRYGNEWKVLIPFCLVDFELAG